MKWYNSPKWLRGLVKVLLSLLVFFPVAYILFCSLKNPTSSETEHLWVFLYDRFSFAGYRQMLFQNHEYWIGFWNTISYVLPIVGLTYVFSTLAAYALVMAPRRVKKWILGIYILLALLPTQVLLVPNFVVLHNLDMIGSRWAVILACCFSPYYVYFTYRFCRQIPPELFEAARLDGAGEFAIYRCIAIPQMRAGLYTLILICTSDFWNMIEQPLVFLQDITKYPLSLSMRDMQTASQSVGAIIYAIPLVLLFLMCRKDLEQEAGRW